MLVGILEVMPDISLAFPAQHPLIYGDLHVKAAGGAGQFAANVAAGGQLQAGLGAVGGAAAGEEDIGDICLRRTKCKQA